MLFQDGALFSSLTVAQNIEVPLREHLRLKPALRREIALLKIAMTGLPPGAATTKVREAGVDSQALSLALREALDAAWRQVIEARFGCATYADMRAALRDG